ncbi:MAG: heme-binding protein, partial [Spirochaetaceae bacterium]|nr:heme-binding protein [Spirochaetaceae bacterium]
MYSLEELLEQENTLQFASFSSETAWELGQKFVEAGQKGRLPITIDIALNRHQLFHFSFPGTSADNDEWVRRKINLVNRFGHSSFYIGQTLKACGKTIK